MRLVPHGFSFKTMIGIGAAVTMLLAACSPAAQPAPTSPPPTAPKPAATAAPAAAPTAAPAAKPAAATAAPAAGQPAAKAWVPTKPVELVAHVTPGGGADVFVRMIADLVQKNKLMTQSLVVVNKSGASGANALSYLNSKRGDDHTLMGMVVALVVTAIGEPSVPQPKDWTKISLLQMDPTVWLVRANSPYKDVKQLLAAAKAEPKKISVGFGSVGSSDHQAFFRVAKATGAEFNYVNFGSGAEAMTALLGGHIDMASGQPSEALEQIKAGKLRGMLTLSDERLPILPDVPTAIELGIKVTGELPRGVVGPPGMPKEAVAYYEGVMKKVTETADWKAYIKETNVIDKYLNSADFTKYIDDLSPRTEALMKDMGLLKK